jgi:hypothetical protein
MTLTDWKRPGATLEPITLEQIEAENLHEDDGRVPHVPFGFGNDQWLRLKEQIQPGDVFYFFSSPKEAWRNLAGRAGYMLVRGDEIVDTLVTIMN